MVRSSLAFMPGQSRGWMGCRRRLLSCGAIAVPILRMTSTIPRASHCRWSGSASRASAWPLSATSPRSTRHSPGGGPMTTAGARDAGEASRWKGCVCGHRRGGAYPARSGSATDLPPRRAARPGRPYSHRPAGSTRDAVSSGIDRRKTRSRSPRKDLRVTTRSDPNCLCFAGPARA